MSNGHPADDEVLREVVLLEVARKQVYGDNPEEDYYEERVTAEFARTYTPPPEAPPGARAIRPTTKRALPGPPGRRADRTTTGGADVFNREVGATSAPSIVDATASPVDGEAPSRGEQGHDRATPTAGSFSVTDPAEGATFERQGVGLHARYGQQSRPGSTAGPRDNQPFDLTQALSRNDYTSTPSADVTREFPIRGHETSRPRGRPNRKRPPTEPSALRTRGSSPWRDPSAAQGRPSPSTHAGSAPQQSTSAPPTTGPGVAAPRPDDLSYTDRIPVRDLLPAQDVVPGRGWRKFLYQASFGAINLGRSPDEIYEEQLQTKVRSHLRGPYKIGVLGKGGVGKTTVVAGVGSMFAELRKNDPLVAVDADIAFGKLGSRIDPNAAGSYWELNADDRLDTFADVRTKLGINAAGLFVLSGEANPTRRRALDPAVYREAVVRLARFFPLQIIDCSAAVDSPVTQEVLADLDALIVVTSPWVDGAGAAGQILDWLAARERTNLLQRTVIVLNDSDGHAGRRMKSVLAQQFRGGGHAVIEVPYDRRLRPGGAIAGTADMSAKSRRRFLELAAALAEHFSARGSGR